MKIIKVSTVVYEMLLELSKKKRIRPDDLIDKLIKNEYEGMK